MNKKLIVAFLAGFIITASALYHKSESTDLQFVINNTVTVGCTVGHGSGFVLEGRPDEIITARHVGEIYTDVPLYVQDFRGNTYTVVAARMHPIYDLAVLTLDRSTELPGFKTAKAILGEEVFAVGTPIRMEFHTLISHGIISGLREIRGLGVMLLSDVIINPGNSGGPLVNKRGEAVGVVVATINGSLSIIVPIENLKE